ncbi:50S ribosomal protein L18 [Nanoarchaeota archaeon]|nr:MAG: 50S ribosomal protein L18 [Nanoarchaeota archaeon]
MKATYAVKFRRRREGRTDYRKRLKLLSSGKIRFVVRRSLNGFWCQFIKYERNGDKVIASAHSRELRNFGYLAHLGNLPSAYLTGLLAGIKAKEAGVKEAILDLGLQRSTKGSSLYACLKGALEAGINIPHSPEILPSEERLSGAHIAAYAKALKEEDPKKYERQFSNYLKNGFDPMKIVEHVEKVKERILRGG